MDLFGDTSWKMSFIFTERLRGQFLRMRLGHGGMLQRHLLASETLTLHAGLKVTQEHSHMPVPDQGKPRPSWLPLLHSASSLTLVGILSLPHIRRAESGTGADLRPHSCHELILPGVNMQCCDSPKECGEGWARGMMRFHPEVHKSVPGNFSE